MAPKAHNGVSLFGVTGCNGIFAMLRVNGGGINSFL
jgi:hypothetical protein